MAVAAALPLIMAAGQVVQGVAGYAAGRKNRKALRAQALDEINNGAVEAERIRSAAREAMGGQVAAQFSNGMFGGTGSALDALAESQINAAIDGLSVKREAESKARALRQQGQQAAAQGRDALIGGAFGAVSTYAGARADWASASRGSTPLPRGGSPVPAPSPAPAPPSSGRKGPV
jgi:hypothetical protein